MGDTASRRLVIDVSVANTAGPPRADQPDPSRSCAAFLDAVRQSEHLLVMTQDIEREWDASDADFATRWRSTMVSIGRVHFSRAGADGELRAKIGRSVKGVSERQEMLKDAHLIEAAVDTDRRVVSCDETVRRLYRRVARMVDSLREIVWVNPTKTTDEKPILWLERGAPAEPCRKLGYRRPRRVRPH